MTNIIKYKSRRGSKDRVRAGSKRAGGSVSFTKRELRQELRRALKSASEAMGSGVLVSGTYWC